MNSVEINTVNMVMSDIEVVLEECRFLRGLMPPGRHFDGDELRLHAATGAAWIALTAARRADRAGSQLGLGIGIDDERLESAIRTLANQSPSEGAAERATLFCMRVLEPAARKRKAHLEEYLPTLLCLEAGT